MDISLGRRLAAEGVGTAFLLAAVVGSGIMAEQLSGGNNALALLANAVATGAVLYVLITMFGPISGAHFNPVVTVVMGLLKEISPLDAFLYIVIQIACAIAGVLLAHAMFDLDILQNATKARIGPGLNISEAVATFGLVATILLVRRSYPDKVALSVALFVTGGYWFTASTCFANPAVTIARSFSNTFAGIASGGLSSFIAFQGMAGIIAWIFCTWLLSKPVRRPSEIN